MDLADYGAGCGSFSLMCNSITRSINLTHHQNLLLEFYSLQRHKSLLKGNYVYRGKMCLRLYDTLSVDENMM